MGDRVDLRISARWGRVERTTCVLLALLVVAFAGALGAQTTSQPAGPTVDATIQGALKSMSLKPASLDDFVAMHDSANPRWTLVMIWSTTCHVCDHEVPKYAKFAEQSEQTGIDVVGVALDGFDGRDAVKRFFREREVSLTNLMADPRLFSLEYAARVGEALRGTPTFLLFSPDGRLRANNPGALRIEALERYVASKQ